jgi:hypothetical protein
VLHGNCFLLQEGKIEGRVEVTGRRARRRKQLLGLQEKGGYFKYNNNNNKLKMGRHPVAVVTLHISYTRTMGVDYYRFSWGGLHGKHVVATWKGNNGNHSSICPRTQENQEKPVSRWPIEALYRNSGELASEDGCTDRKTATE